MLTNKSDRREPSTRWHRIYAGVIGFLLLQILLYSIITELLK